jgi:hypothetical protein
MEDAMAERADSGVSRRELLRKAALGALALGAVPAALLPRLSQAEDRSAPPLPHRWFRAGHDVADPAQRTALLDLIGAASEHGYNGLLLSTGTFDFRIKDPATVAGLREVKAACERRGFDLIPCVPGVGWGGALWNEDPYLVAGVPVTGTLMAVRGGRAVLEPDPPVGIANGGFEQFEGDAFARLTADAPGRCTFADREMAHSGAASLRMEHVGRATGGYRMCRVGQEVTLKPNRCYRISARVKTQDLASVGALNLYVFRPGLQWPPLPFRWISRPRPTSDWTHVGYLFNSWEGGRAFAYVGLWGAREDDPGRLWVDDFRLEEVGPGVAVRREGTPVVVRKEGSDEPLVEGKDFTFPIEPKPSYWWAGYEGPTMRVLADGPAELKEGDRLRVDWYEPAIGASTAICMSEPRLYEIYREWFALMHRELAPSKYLLSMDEVRGGCTCALCKSRGLSNGDILADCVNRQFALIRDISSTADVLVWGDMFDPAMNAAPGDFWWVPGGFGGSWKTLNRDLIIACWSDLPVERARIRASLEHFSGLGFRTLGGAYYDAADLEGSKAWLGELARTPGAYGIVYTTWSGHYGLMPAFGDLVSGRRD